MEKTKKQRTTIRSVYVAPSIEMYAAELNQLMELSGQHEIDGDDGEENGAKGMSLDISFTDLWEE